MDRIEYFGIEQKCFDNIAKLDHIIEKIKYYKKQLRYCIALKDHKIKDDVTRCIYIANGIENPIKYWNELWKKTEVETEEIMDFFKEIHPIEFKEEIKIAKNLYNKIVNF